jgi:hypothetical protein
VKNGFFKNLISLSFFVIKNITGRVSKAPLINPSIIPIGAKPLT